jgi:bifunctional N-acetylglutamate synthase/kinase
VVTLENGVPYLCKFAVATSAQGQVRRRQGARIGRPAPRAVANPRAGAVQGIADLLWAAITRDHQDLFWRSRADNTVNPWYFARAHGSLRLDRWTVFWYGLRGRDMMSFYRDHCQELLPTFHQPLPTPLS